MVNNIGLHAVADIYEENPAQAETAWLTIDAVSNGIGGEIEIVGGVWVVLLSIAGLRSGTLSRALSIYGLVVGSAGIATLVPALTEAGGGIFGMSQIVWFVWMGVSLQRDASVVHTDAYDRASAVPLSTTG